MSGELAKILRNALADVPIAVNKRSVIAGMALSVLCMSADRLVGKDKEIARWVWSGYVIRTQQTSTYLSAYPSVKGHEACGRAVCEDTYQCRSIATVVGTDTPICRTSMSMVGASQYRDLVLSSTMGATRHR